MTSFRLIADDLTGALDTAVEFTGLCGAIPIFWTEFRANGSPPLPACFAIDSGSRELDREAGIAIMARLVPLIRNADIAFKKVDSLMRGAWASELAACLRLGAWSSCVVAPAFAYQGRKTVDGQQFARAHDGSWFPVGLNLLAELESEGLEVHRGRGDADLLPGVTVFDAENDDDLDRVVAIGRRSPQPVLWCGSGGLAAALARGSNAAASSLLREPVLGLFGSDQAATAAQLAACGSLAVRLTENAASNTDLVARRLDNDQAVMVGFDLAPGLSRAEAAHRIARELTALTARLGPPGTLIVAGGETLKALCLTVGATSLQTEGRIVPGLPRSVIQGGRWDGVDVVSKSGAFGPPNLWRDLLIENRLLSEKISP
jgi:D-threonate/D-erythronate kinase